MEEKHELSQMQSVLLETYKEFKNFCSDNGIKFYAAYGTLLGAIRHQGFIPWDDDMDVFMLRPEYEKFISLRDKLPTSAKYRIADYHDDGYPYIFGKFFDSTKTFLEFPHFPYVFGPYIDIFVLDEWTDGSNEHIKLYEEHQKAFWNYRKSISYDPWKEILADFIHLNGYEGPMRLVKKLYFRPLHKFYVKKLDKIMKSMKEARGEFLLDYSEYIKRNISKDWFEDIVEMPFEDTTIPVPYRYDECLTVLYGDYMSPPQVSERTGHKSYYIDLERKLSLDEILKIKPKPKPHRKPIAWKVILNELKHRGGY